MPTLESSEIYAKSMPTFYTGG